MAVRPVPAALISPRIYALILTTPRLRRRLLPGGLVTSPYEILDYDATLVLHAPQGRWATFQRTQRIRFLQDGVSAILDHAWGDGILLTGYRNSAGQLERTLRDEGRRHLVVALKRPMKQGEELFFRVERTARAGFTDAEEWLETVLDHPVERLSRTIIFPPDRPCRAAILRSGDAVTPLPIIPLPDGRTCVRFEVLGPSAHVIYAVHWVW